MQIFLSGGQATVHKTIMQVHDKGIKTCINYNCTPDYTGILFVVHAGNMWVSVLLRGGLTILNLTAFSGVVSGQSLSKVIGMFFATSSSSSSSQSSHNQRIYALRF